MPETAEAFNTLGTRQRLHGDYSDAIRSLRRAIEIAPEFPEAYYNLGNCLRDIEQFDPAVACFQIALRQRPGFPEAMSNLGETLQTIGRIAEARHWFKSACELLPDNAGAFSNYLLALNYDPDLDPPQLFREHERYAAAFQPKAPRSHSTSRTPDRKLRIGYVSADLRKHPVACFLLPVFEHHTRNWFEVYVYSGVSRPDEVTAEFRKLSDCWIDAFELDDGALAERIKSDAIDILIDLSGHTAGNRLAVFARKPAPVQISYLGYPNTTGLTAVDYRITDAVIDPPGEAALLSEQPIRLSPCFCCYRPPVDAPLPGPLPFQQEGLVTFGSTHTLPRINDRVIDLWAELLSRVPQSRLLIARTALKGNALERMSSSFETRGISRNRLVIQNTISKEGHLSVYNRIDISLDSFPWCGHTTVCESLWMGVPVVTLLGNRSAGRVAASVLTCLGMPECIGPTREEYLTAAIGLASAPQKLERWRRELRSVMTKSILCDGGAFCKNLEDDYRRMWQQFCSA